VSWGWITGVRAAQELSRTLSRPTGCDGGAERRQAATEPDRQGARALRPWPVKQGVSGSLLGTHASDDVTRHVSGLCPGVSSPAGEAAELFLLSHELFVVFFSFLANPPGKLG